MTTQYDGGIVRHYIEQFLALGVKSHMGDDVAMQVEQLVQTAFEHFDIWVERTPAENKRSLLSQLRMQAELVAQSTPAQARVLMDAYRFGTEKLSAA